MTSISLTGPVEVNMLGSSLAQFFTQIAVGQGWFATILMTAVISVLTFAARGQGGVAAALLLAFIALVPLALQGHAAGAGNHVTATIALWLHVAGAAVWVGGLAAVTYAAAFDERSWVALVRRYSAIALAGLCAVTISGMAGALVRLSQPAQLLTTDYGRLLSLKLVALLLLVGLGWLQRTWVIRRFDSAVVPGLQRRLAFGSLALWELLVMGVAMGAGATLSRTETPGGQILLATKAEQLTGDRVPYAPGVARFLDTWVFDAAAVFGVLLGLGAYLYGVCAARRHGGWPRSRTTAAVLAAVVILFAFCSLPGAYATFSFAAYAAMLLLGGMLAAVLVVAARPARLLHIVVGLRGDGSLGAREWTTWMLGGRALTVSLRAPWLSAAALVALLAAVVLSPWLGWAVQDPVGRVLTTLLLFGVTSLFAVSVLRTAGGGQRLMTQAVGIAMAVVLAVGLIAVVVAFLPGGVLPAWYGVTMPALGVTPAVDQLIGAVLLWAIAAVAVFALLLVLGRRVIESRSEGPGEEQA
ncbi:hypothetical protein DOE76_14550 [Leifsonia sp. ku-ls]|nr:hypothetical protein DOE76_14550 [Leifsonia sp. ku-ls]